MSDPIGYRRWAIAEGRIPASGDESACILNASDDDAHLHVTVFFSDREPVGPYLLTVPAHRTLHAHFHELEEPEPIPRNTDFSSVIESDVPVVVQHSRVNPERSELS